MVVVLFFVPSQANRRGVDMVAAAAAGANGGGYIDNGAPPSPSGRVPAARHRQGEGVELFQTARERAKVHPSWPNETMPRDNLSRPHSQWRPPTVPPPDSPFRASLFHGGIYLSTMPPLSPSSPFPSAGALSSFSVQCQSHSLSLVLLVSFRCVLLSLRSCASTFFAPYQLSNIR
jgi:hypothetical protein